MNVIAITGRDSDFAVAVVQIPEGKTADETFVAWVRAGCNGGSSGYEVDGWSDEKIMREVEYAWQEMPIQQVF
jgi:hypothetical protein